MQMDWAAIDPDFVYLQLAKKTMLEIQGRPYSGAKSVWVVDDKLGFARAEVESTKGDDVTCKKEDMTTVTVHKDKVQQMNPPKFELITDMANMTYLNEACVLNNLRMRYENTLIYTYSGLFCIAVNPYRRLPIYTKKVTDAYQGKRRTEVPPHLFAIADTAYANMIRDRENQSCLITGESGAGKTENTKKVISYFALVAAGGSGGGEEESKGSLEDRIVQTNPVLEAWGNAKTVRNNNSSRFGKFIRIHFGPNGKIAGADIESYLLEKSRITYQMPGLERNYHIFYWIMSGEVPAVAEMCHVKEDPGLYGYINQGTLTVDNMDDKEEMRLVDEAFAVLGFDDEKEKNPSYKITASVVHFGEMRFKQRGEQAEPEGMQDAEKVAHLLGVNANDMMKSMVTPKVKVGTEMVTKGQTQAQVEFGVQALAKCIFARFFAWLVARANQTLDTKQKRQYFIGVLDIAGFEIFEFNTFEQLCINYTNECLQQFFNHHMFVLEQEEYKKEGIVWEFIDFGMDLLSTIDLIEKPMGILSILQEECMFPKASDKSFLEKLYENHLKKSKMFGKPKPSKNAKYIPHFEVYHYAGTVQYNIDGWLNKNKDPINDCVSQLFAASKDPLVASFFKVPDEPAGGGGKKKKKGGGMQTISAVHKEQLHKLMATLKSTTPSFVRCLIPNEQKQPGMVEAHLVLHQLQCNGVLEGIRICRKGFPNRMIYSEFKQRYTILAPNAVPAGFVDGKEASSKVLAAIPDFDQDSYRCGHTKVFFKAGVLGQLEEIRDEKLTRIVNNMQAWVRGYLQRASYEKLGQQRIAFTLIQRNVRKWLSLKTWIWWKIYTRVKPLLSMARAEDDQKKMQEEYEKTKEHLEGLEKKYKLLEERVVMLDREKDELKSELAVADAGTGEQEERLEQLLKDQRENEDTIKELEERISEAEGDGEALEAAKSKLEGTIKGLKGDVENLELSLNKAETEKKTKDSQIATLNDEMARQDEAIAKLNKEKKNQGDNISSLTENLQAEEDKVNHLNKLKQKLEGQIDELEDNLEREKKVRADVEKAKRKIEGELKQTQETVEDLGRAKSDLENNVRKKDADIKSLEGKLEEESNLVAQLQKKIKELLARIEELEEELEAERANRSKVEKARSALQSELDDLSEKLDEAGGATQAQLELNKRREAELSKMRRDLEEAAVSSEQTIASLRKKQNDMAAELQDQIDNLGKGKSKAEKERNSLKSEADDLATQLDQVSKQKANAEKSSKSLAAQLSESNAKLDEASRQVQELNASKARLGSESGDLGRQLEEAESQANALAKAKSSLAKQLEEAKGALEEESRQRQKLSGEVRNLHGDLDAARDQLEEESEGRADMQRLLTKANNEAQEWRRRLESGEGGASAEALDDLKRKYNVKLADAEAQAEAALSKSASLEKVRYRLQGEMEDLQIEYERASAFASQAEKRQRAFDKTVDEWKRKVVDIQAELDNALKESRANAADVYRMRAQVDESNDAVESLRRENKNLSDEIRDLTDQLGEGGRSVHELEKSRKRLEMEKEELQSALEEAEAALEQEEVKVQRAQLEIQTIRQDIDRRLAEKDEEFESTRKNFQRQLDSIQASLEAEARGRSEALRAKKKLEGDINELEVALDGANRGRADAEKNAKRYSQQARELQTVVEQEQRSVADAKEQFQASERRNNLLAGEVEEIRTQFESGERARKAAEGELQEAIDRVSELSVSNASLASAKRKLDNDLQSIQVDLEDQAGELKSAEAAAQKAVSDAARIAEELRQEQEHSGSIEKMRRTLESQVKELQARLDEAEANALKGGKRIIQKLEQRVRELEVELDNEQRRHAETTKGLRKQDRRLKELAFQADEDRKQQERAADMIDKLQGKIKTYKRQVEEAEEIAAVNLAKYRKVQHELEDAEERADMSENTLAKLRAKNRSGSVVQQSSSSSVKITVREQ